MFPSAALKVWRVRCRRLTMLSTSSPTKTQRLFGVIRRPQAGRLQQFIFPDTNRLLAFA